VNDQHGPDLMDYILGNFEHLEELTEQYRERKKQLKEKDPLFQEEIDNQYKEHVKYLICLEISRDMACSYEEAVVLYEEIGLGELFV
jgi:response regulator of citrate/malate metabolism